MKKLAASLLFCGLVTSTVALAGWTKAGVSQATFSAIGTGGFKMEGKTPTVDVTDDGKTVSVVVGLTELVTGISLRDRHMRDKYLEVAKFPTTTLAVGIDALKIPAAAGAIEGDATGKMTLHGVTKDQPFHYKGTCKADGICDLTGTITLNMNDYGVVVPSYLGITVKPNVTIGTTFSVKRP
jgi:polyisoprenoid-binding protein YceI